MSIGYYYHALEALMDTDSTWQCHISLLLSDNVETIHTSPPPFFLWKLSRICEIMGHTTMQSGTELKSFLQILEWH
jgi:hypothetical protein